MNRTNRKPKPRAVARPTDVIEGERPSSVTVETVRRQLLDEQRRILRRVDDTGGQLQSLQESAPSEMEEEAQELNMAEVLTRLGERDRAELDAIAAALDRIAGGEYGACTICGEAIPSARLLVL